DVTDTNHGEKAEPNDRFYRCKHGESSKVLRMTKAMRGSLNGLTGHLKTHAPDMFRFYEMLNGRAAPPSPEEIAVAEGEKPLQPGTSSSFTSLSVPRPGSGPWDQTKFEQLLVEWLVACDQPFQEVE
ncbi:hypothetical protein B0H16DRAFT_1241934, partial [Mycena metata]